MAKKKTHKQIHAPHDKLFKAVFSQPENAAAHFEAILPSSLVATLDLPAAALVPGTFVDDALPDRRTDLLYRIPWREDRGHSSGDTREVLLYVVFEHQSSVDTMMPFRMLRYAIRIWERWLAKNPKAHLLPPILPLVLYHGEKRWTAALELLDLLKVEGLEENAWAALQSYLPNLKLLFHELSEVPDDKLPHRPPVRLTLFLFKHGRKPKLLELLDPRKPDLRALVESGNPGLRHLGFLVNYILTVNDYVTKEALGKKLASLGREAGEIAMTEGERLIEQGRKEGWKQGCRHGRQEHQIAVARRLLAKGMAIEEVAELVELSVEEVRKLTQ